MGIGEGGNRESNAAMLSAKLTIKQPFPFSRRPNVVGMEMSEMDFALKQTTPAKGNRWMQHALIHQPSLLQRLAKNVHTGVHVENRGKIRERGNSEGKGTEININMYSTRGPIVAVSKNYMTFL